MIEMLVALVLSSVVIGVAVAGIIGAIGASADSRANSVSAAMLENATALLTSDVSLAETAARRAGMVRDVDDLRHAVQNGTVPQSTDPGNPGPANIDDVVTAKPGLLRFWADVEQDASGAVECVTWEADPSGAKFKLIRHVESTCGPNATSLSRTVVLEAPSDLPGLVKTPFSYELQCNRAQCGPDSEASPARRCETWLEKNGVAQPKRMRWIVGVRASFVGASQQSSGMARSGSHVGMTIRSRDIVEWRGALGC